MQIAPDEIRLLAQVGLMAANRSDIESAKKIFAAVEQERPKASIAFVGLAIAHLQAGDLQGSVRCLERGLAQVDAADRPELHAFLALAYRLGGLHDRSEKALSSAGSVPLAQGLRRESVQATGIPACESQAAR
ncbi:MAG: tetratricopeptide repeat protein [Ramlibacter sp.]|jgi:predicted Zn-dependent protease